jgi:hypothetical protein
MNISRYKAEDYENKSDLLTMEKQTQSNPILSVSSGIHPSTNPPFLKNLTLCQIITYEKQPPEFGSIRAIWRTIGAISRVFRVLSESDSRAIRDNWR